MEPDEQNLALSQGLLGLGAGLLSGSFGHYGAMAPALGQGMQGFNQGYSNALNMGLHMKMFNQQKLLQDAQIANYHSEEQKRNYDLQQQQASLANASGADDYATNKLGLAPPPPPPAQVMPTSTFDKGIFTRNAPRVFNDQKLPSPTSISENQVDVTADGKSKMINPDWHLARAEYLLSKGDRKGADEALKQSMSLRNEERTLGKDELDKPLEGVSGVTFNPKNGIYKEDGKQISAARVQEIKLAQQRAGASSTEVKVNSYLPASEEAQRDFIKSTRATYDQLKQAPVMIDSIEKAKALIPGAKGFMGPGGESLLDTVKFLNNRIGLNINSAGVKDAEELRTRIFFNIMDNLKKMDAQPSQQQQQIMQEALGKLGTDPGALPRVLDAFEDVIRGKVDLHNNEVQGAMKRMVKFPYDPLITLPQRGGKAMLPQGWSVEEVK